MCNTVVLETAKSKTSPYGHNYRIKLVACGAMCTPDDASRCGLCKSVLDCGTSESGLCTLDDASVDVCA